jgi:hypothetical protein
LLSEDIEVLGNIVLGFSPEDLEQITNNAFKGAIHTLGQTDGFDREQLRVLALKAKEAYK